MRAAIYCRVSGEAQKQLGPRTPPLRSYLTVLGTKYWTCCRCHLARDRRYPGKWVLSGQAKPVKGVDVWQDPEGQ